MGVNGGGWDGRKLRDEQACLDRMLERARVQLRINLTDVEHECPHGCLPLDRKKPEGCSCWTVAMTDALARRVQENPDYSDAA